MGYIGAKSLKEINKRAKFIKITKAGFYESMVHSVEVTQNQIIINYEDDSFKININFFLLMNFLHAKSDYFSEGVNLYKKKIQRSSI